MYSEEDVYNEGWNNGVSEGWDSCVEHMKEYLKLSGKDMLSREELLEYLESTK